MRAIVVLLALLIAGSACAYPAPDYDAVKPATLRLKMPGGVCSGTAIGPGHHLVLTDEHCLQGGIKGWRINGRAAVITGVILDGNDHALLTTDLYFEHVARFGPKPKQGDEVFSFGNPAAYPDILLTGHVAGWAARYMGVADVMVLDRNDWYGCSGAAVFDRYGRIVGVVNAMFPWPNQGWRLTAIFPLAFTPAQWRVARSGVASPPPEPSQPITIVPRGHRSFPM